MSEAVVTTPAAPAAPAVPVAAPQGETATTPSVAGGAELGTHIPGRAAAIAKAREAMQGRDNASMDQATKQAEEHAAKTRAKAEREKTPAPERGEDGKFKPALSPEDAKQQTKVTPPAAKAEPAKADQAVDLEDESKLEEEWRKVRSAKKTARDEKRAATEWRAEQARAAAEKTADERLRKESPAKWLEKHEFDFREVAKQSVAKVEKTPTEKVAEAALEKAERLEKELAARDQRDAEASQQRAMESVKREHAQAWQESSGEYPTLSAHYETSEILDTLTELRVSEYVRTKREVPISVALEHMEKLARREQARFNRTADPAKPVRTERATVAPKGAKSRAVVGPVTNKDAATAATPTTGLTPEERRARSTSMVAAGWRR